MKKTFLFYLAALFSMLGIVSCTEEPPYSNMLVATPKVIAYSGDTYFGGGTRSAQPNANEWGTDLNNGKYKDYPKPADITAEELAKVLEVFNQKGKESYEPLVDWENFFVQQVYCGPEGPKMTELACVSNQQQTNWWPEEFATVDWYDDIVNNFNNGLYSGQEQGCMLMFHSSTSNWSFKSTQGGGERFYNWRMEYIDGAYYVGFDFQSNKQGSDANENELFERDYVYNDWIIKIVPAVGTEITPPETTEPEIPSGTVKHNHQDEVEVNLHGAEKNGNYMESHLSIHIRCATDVEVFIPVPKKYTCDKDDMEIVMKHELNHMTHNSTFTLKDSNLQVSITVSYEDDGIRITTDGVTQEVIDWCMEKCHDGITFEVWNYFNTPDVDGLSLEELQYWLNQSTIEFLDDFPDYYINAFGEDSDKDCTVLPEDGYEYSHTGEHLNGTNKNNFYVPEE